MLFRKLLSYQKTETSIKISLKGALKGELWTHGGISEIKLMSCDAPDASEMEL